VNESIELGELISTKAFERLMSTDAPMFGRYCSLVRR
jgi:hypothetical protein